MKKSQKNIQFTEARDLQEQDEKAKKSDHKEEYFQFFQEIELPKIQDFHEELSRMGIEYHPGDFIFPMAMRKFSESQNSKVLSIYVSMGWFTLKIMILNSLGSSPARKRLKTKGSGAFGIIYQYVDHFNNEFAIKNIALQKQQIFNNQFAIQSEKQMVIKQYCFYKLFSCMKIGPKVENYFGYDLIVFDDCIEFALEMCEKIPNSTFNNKSFIQLKTDLMLMHSIGIVHNDIKSENIMFSPAYNKLVFIDYNLSKVLREKIGEKTLTIFIGTFTTSSPDMKKLYWHRISEFVDLYHNDAFALDLFCKSSEGGKIVHKKQGLKESEVNNVSQCFYLHIKLRYFITNKSLMQCQNHLLKFENGMKVTEEMRKNNKQIIQVKKKYDIFIKPHLEIAEINNIIEETLSMLIQVNLTKKMIKIKEILFVSFDPSPQLKELINKIYENKSLILPSNLKIIEKYKSRLKFKPILAKSSTTVKMLELVSAVCICKLPEQQSRRFVDEFIIQIDDPNTTVLQILDKLDDFVSYYNASDEDYVKLFDKIILKSQMKFQQQLSAREKYQQIIKLKAKLKRQIISQPQNKQNLMIKFMCQRLEKYVDIHREIDNSSHLQICEKLRKMLEKAKIWRQQFLQIVIELKEHCKISYYTTLLPTLWKMEYLNHWLKHQKQQMQFEILESRIIEKIENLQKSFISQFSESISPFVMAICSYILYISIDRELSPKISSKKEQALEYLYFFLNRYNFNIEDLASFILIIKVDYFQQHNKQKLLFSWNNYSSMSLQNYCYLFYNNLILACLKNPIKNEGIGFSQVMEYVTKKSATIQLAREILSQPISTPQFQSEKQFIFNFYSQELFTKSFLMQQNICDFYLLFFQTYYEDKPKEILNFTSLLTEAIKENFIIPYPIEYWRIIIRANARLNRFKQFESIIDEILQQYPSIKNKKIEQLYSEITEINLENSEKQIKMIEKFIDHHISQLNFTCFSCKYSFCICMNYLLKSQKFQKLVQLLFSIIQHPKFTQQYFEHFKFHECLKICFKALMNKSLNQVAVVIQFVFEKIANSNLRVSEHACTIIYHLYQIVVFYDIRLKNRSEILRKFLIFLLKNIERSAFEFRREAQIDWFYFASLILKCEPFKFHIPQNKINQRHKYFMLKHFRQKAFKDYCDGTAVIKQILMKNKYNKKRNILKILDKIDQYSDNKMLDISYNGFINEKQQQKHYFNSKTNKCEFFIHNNLLVCPLPQRSFKTWKIKAKNLINFNKYFYYSVYEIKSRNIRAKRKTLILKFHILDGKLFEIAKMHAKMPICSQIVTLKICRESSSISWQDDGGRVVKHIDSIFGSRQAEFSVYLNYSNFKTYFQFE